MTIGTWSDRERRELFALQQRLERMYRKAVNLSDTFNAAHWPAEIAAPLKNVVDALAEAVDSIYRDRGR